MESQNVNKVQYIWQIDLDYNKLIELSIADLYAIETLYHRTGEGETNNFRTINKAILFKLGQLSK